MSADTSAEMRTAATSALASLDNALRVLKSVYEAHVADSIDKVDAEVDMKNMTFEHGLDLLARATTSEFYARGRGGGGGGGGGKGGGGRGLGGGIGGGRIFAGGGGGGGGPRRSMSSGGGGLVVTRPVAIPRPAAPSRSLGRVFSRNPVRALRKLPSPGATRVRLPAGYRLGRTTLTKPWAWADRSRGLVPYRIGSAGGYIFNPVRAYWRPWGSYRGFLGGITNLALWLTFPWFSLWYSSYLINPLDPFAVNAYYTRPVLGLGLPALGYVDLRNWTPQEIDQHIRQLEMVYAATVALGYRIIVDPATGRLLWVSNVRMPAVPPGPVAVL